MSTDRRLLFYVLIYIYLIFALVDGSNNPLLKRFENCNPSIDYPAMFNVKIKTVGDKQYMDGTLNFTTSLDNALQVNATVEILIMNNYQYLFTIHEKKACDAMHKYLGEFIYDIERHAQLIPGMCPIPKGVRRVHNYPFTIDTVTTLANFPFGTIRVKIILFDRRNVVYTCIYDEFEHYM